MLCFKAEKGKRHVHSLVQKLGRLFYLVKWHVYIFPRIADDVLVMQRIIREEGRHMRGFTYAMGSGCWAGLWREEGRVAVRVVCTNVQDE